MFWSIYGYISRIYREQFGSKNNSVNYGIMFIGFALAGYFGPTIMTTIFNKNGSYHSAFIIASILNIAGIAFAFIYHLLVNKKTKEV